MKEHEINTRIAARAAYRLGMLDALLHPDVIGTLMPAAIVTESLTGEREHRLHELEHVGIRRDDLSDLELGEGT